MEKHHSFISFHKTDAYQSRDQGKGQACIHFKQQNIMDRKLKMKDKRYWNSAPHLTQRNWVQMSSKLILLQLCDTSDHAPDFHYNYIRGYLERSRVQKEPLKPKTH